MLVAAVLAAALLEVILRDDAAWPLVVGVAPAILLPWRRINPVLVIAVVFGSILLTEAVAEPLYSTAYVLLLPYALLRWGSGREAVTGMAIVIPVHALSMVLSGDELHDTVAHHVSAIVIRAQAGRAQPAAAVDALEVIEEEASRTLAELRALVGTLRPDLAPQRGVADIERLAETNSRVDVQLAGDLVDVRPLVGAALYRIAQESITNAIRHARRATRIDVRVTGDHDCVRLTVRDDGDGGSPGAPGFGLLGMTERAALLGGTLDARPNGDSGWTVTAVLPR